MNVHRETLPAVSKLNPGMKIFEVSAKTGAGIRDWVEWLKGEVRGNK